MQEDGTPPSTQNNTVVLPSGNTPAVETTAVGGEASVVHTAMGDEQKSAHVDDDTTDPSRQPADVKPVKEDDGATTPHRNSSPVLSPRTCWICYEEIEEHEMLSPCKCKGTLQYAHKSCLLEWLSESQTTSCPHCNYKYNIETTYTSWLEEWLDHPHVPYVLSALVLALLFYAFHRLFTRLMKVFRKRLSASRASASTMFHRPEAVGLLRTALPTFHPALSLFMSGFHANDHRTAQWSVTMLFAEFEIFAAVVVLLFCVSRYAYTYFMNRNNSSDNASEDANTDTVATTDVHEGFAEVSLLSEDQPSNPPPTATSPPSDAALHGRFTVWDVVNQFWQETNVGSSTSLTEDAVYLFPFDVAQTTFYTLHYYLKQQQQIFINKNVVIAPAQSQSLSNASST